MSYEAQLKINGEFAPNVMRFVGEQEALDFGQLLAARWQFNLPEGVRVVASGDPVTHTFANGVLSKIEAA